ncbi:hypothetical protein [Amphritea sp. HPY]|uniref:hypothetical protein n=1 Tax=Amphritea sp. HPY TaxID=3421652 RepID=UPI003D7C528D
MNRIISGLFACLLFLPLNSYSDISSDLSSGDSLISAITKAVQQEQPLQLVLDQLLTSCLKDADISQRYDESEELVEKNHELEVRLEQCRLREPEALLKKEIDTDDALAQETANDFAADIACACAEGNTEAIYAALISVFSNDNEALTIIGKSALNNGITEVQLITMALAANADITALLEQPSAGVPPISQLINSTSAVPFADINGRGGISDS